MTAALDSGHVVVTGPTTKTVTAAPGATVTIDALLPGTYTVGLEGFTGGGVGYFTQITGVTVVAGQNTTTTVPSFPAFQPTILSIPPYTVDGTFQLVFSKVAAAKSYVVQRSASPNFTPSLDTAIAVTDTSVQVSIPTSGLFNVRVLAVDTYGTKGQPSTAQAVTTLTSVTVSPATASIAPGATQQFSAVAKDAAGNTISGINFFWASSNQNVALVDQTGLATGVAGGGGTATISALGLGVPGGASLTVAAAFASQLVFNVQPSNTPGNTAVSPAVQVTLKDAAGNLVPTGSVTLSLANAPWPAPGSRLSGTVTASAASGVASFSNLVIDKPGSGYTLQATSGTATAVSSSFNVSLAFSFVQAGNSQTCGIATGGSYCWGNNYSGVLGGATGFTYSDSVPVLVTGGFTFVEISTGSSQSCGRTSPGAVYCWGDNSQGELGNGTTNNSLTPVAISAPAGISFVSVSAGSGYSCAASTNGAVYCWGTNSYGLGDVATTTFSTTPILVAGSGVAPLTFTQVSASYYHTCGRTSGNAVYCWGYNGYGGLGNGTNTNSPTPVLVSGSGAAPLTFTSVSVGYLFTCGRTTVSALWCWGYNNDGQLGNATTTASNVPVQVSGSGANPLFFTSVSAGVPFGSHSCGRTSASAVYCWGNNSNGQLGNGTFTNASSPAAVSVPAGVTFASVSTGSSHTCGRDGTTNRIYCWGANYSGQLGDGTQSTRLTPVSVVQ